MDNVPLNLTSFKVNFVIKISLFVLLFLVIENGFSQTKGLIVEPATGGGAAILDPNGDGYISKTTGGFVLNDYDESEIPFEALIFLELEQPGDLGRGPTCGFTEFVETGIEDPTLTYLDSNNNLFYRFRMASVSTNAKSYSILIDTDSLFGNTGPNADPDYTPENPGFEIEIVLATKFGVFIYDVDGTPNCTPVKSYLGTTNYQKSIANSEICGQLNFFLDFYVDFDDLISLFGISTSTRMRSVIVNNMAASKSTVCNYSSISDLAGIGDDCGSLAACYESLIDNQTPCSQAEIDSGFCLEKTQCPIINLPIINSSTTVSGLSSESDSTIIFIYKNGILIGMDTVFSGGWSLTGISPVLLEGDTIQATALAPGKSMSDYYCNTLTVNSAVCSDPVITAFHCGKSIQGRAVVGAIINIYQGDSTIASTPTAGTSFSGGVITSVTTPSILSDPNDNFLWKCVGTGPSDKCSASGAACLIDGAYRITATEPGKCESKPTWICVGGNTGTGDPTITNSSISTDTTSIYGTVASPDNIAGVTVYLYANGFQIGKTTTLAGGIWTISSLTLNSCDTIKAIAINHAINSCPSNYTSEIIVAGGTSDPPVILGDYCLSGSADSVYGTSSESMGSLVRIFDNGDLIDSTNVLTGGLWSIGGLSIPTGNTITATVTNVNTCEIESAPSSGVLVKTQSTNIPIITTSPIYEGASSISGTGVEFDTITIYLDDFPEDGYFAVVPASGIWTITGLPDYIFYTGGLVTATAKTPGFCESNQSAQDTVVCVSPLNNLNVLPGSIYLCSESVIDSIIIPNSQNLIIYQLFLEDESTTTGSSVLGNGDTIILSSGLITSSTVLKVKAFKIGASDCDVFLTDTVPVTISQLDLSSATGVGSNPITCSGTEGSITLSNILPTSGTIYLNYLDGALSVGPDTVTIVGGSITISELNSGTYSQFIFTLPNSSCSDTLDLSINLSGPVITAPINGGDRAYCEGETVPTLAVFTFGQIVSNWYDAAVGGSFLASNVNTYTPTAPGVFYAESIDTVSGCTSSTRTAVTLIRHDSPAMTPQTQTLCSGDTSTTIVIGTTATWSSDIFGFSGSGVTIDSSVANNKGTMAYTITYVAVSANGCEAASTVTVNPEPRIFSVPRNVILCDYEVLSLKFTSVLPSTTINWELTNNLAPGTVIESGSGTDSISISKVGLPAGNYTYTVTGTKSGCASEEMNISVTVN